MQTFGQKVKKTSSISRFLRPATYIYMGPLWFLRRLYLQLVGWEEFQNWSDWDEDISSTMVALQVGQKLGQAALTLRCEVCPWSEQIFGMGNFNCNLWTSSKNLDIFQNRICFWFFERKQMLQPSNRSSLSQFIPNLLCYKKPLEATHSIHTSLINAMPMVGYTWCMWCKYCIWCNWYIQYA